MIKKKKVKIVNFLKRIDILDIYLRWHSSYTTNQIFMHILAESSLFSLDEGTKRPF